MTRRMADATVAFVIALIAWLAVAGCTQPSPTAPSDIIVQNNTGPVSINTTGGSTSPIGTAPCGASSSQKTSPTGPVSAPTCTAPATGNNPSATVAEEVR